MRLITDTFTRRTLYRGITALHARGPDATAEAFAEVAARGLPAILHVLRELEVRPRPSRRRREVR
jgi:hypothetical protein